MKTDDFLPEKEGFQVYYFHIDETIPLLFRPFTLFSLLFLSYTFVYKC